MGGLRQNPADHQMPPRNEVGLTSSPTYKVYYKVHLLSWPKQITYFKLWPDYLFNCMSACNSSLFLSYLIMVIFHLFSFYFEFNLVCWFLFIYMGQYLCSSPSLWSMHFPYWLLWKTIFPSQKITLLKFLFSLKWRAQTPDTQDRVEGY